MRPTCRSFTHSGLFSTTDKGKVLRKPTVSTGGLLVDLALDGCNALVFLIHPSNSGASRTATLPDLLCAAEVYMLIIARVLTAVLESLTLVNSQQSCGVGAGCGHPAAVLL